MALPFRDNLEPRRVPWVTFALIVVNCVVFLLLQPSAFQTAPDDGEGPLDRAEYERVVDAETFVMRWALVPCEIRTGTPVADAPEGCDEAPTRHLPERKSVYLALLSSMFLHGSIDHLAGNLFFLWVFGRNVEDRLGPLVHLAIYLLGGLAASLTSVFTDLHSAVPHLGASGAIAATMGAYLLCYPRARILTQVALPIQFVYLPAAVVLVLYFVTQFFIGSDSNVAWEAHAGGMVAGFLLAIPALRLPWVRRLARPDSDFAATATTSF